jgi:hypothetical protein
MSEYPSGSVEDREMLAEMPTERLLDLFFLQIRNIWRVDGLYFLGIEKRFGTDVTTEIDAEVWKIMATIEAKNLRQMFKIDENPDLATILHLLRKSSWALDQPFKTIDVGANLASLRINKCRTQEARLRKGLPEFPCKKVRFGYLRSFARALNPKAEVKCLVCPPDQHPEGLWCEWAFSL